QRFFGLVEERRRGDMQWAGDARSEQENARKVAFSARRRRALCRLDHECRWTAGPFPFDLSRPAQRLPMPISRANGELGGLPLPLWERVGVRGTLHKKVIRPAPPPGGLRPPPSPASRGRDYGSPGRAGTVGGGRRCFG